MVVQFTKRKTFLPFLPCSPDVGLTHGKVLRKDKNEDHLYVNMGKHIIILFHVSNGKFQMKGNLKQFDDADIDDFRSIKTNGLLSACSNMNIYYHEVDPQRGSRLVCKIDVGIEISENISSIAVCPFDRYIGVATELNDELTNILMFELTGDKMIEFRDEMNFYLDYQFKRQFNYIRDMSLDFYYKGYPIITGFQFAGDRFMMPFAFDGKKIVRLEPVKYNSGIFNKCSSHQGVVWTIDMNGVMKKLSLSKYL